MKKIILSALCGTLLGFGALAADGADETILYGYSTTPYGALNFQEPTEAGMAFQFTQSDVEYFKGCRITAIAVANGTPAKGSTATEQPVTLFTTSGFDAMGYAEEMMTYEGTMDLTRPGLYKEYPLPEPIEITEDMAPIWFGVTAMCDPSVAGVLMFDAWSHEATVAGGMVGVAEKSGDPLIWTDQAARYGFGCIRVLIEGKNLPVNEVSMLDCLIPDFVNTSTTENIEIYLRNEASNNINSVTVAYTLGSEEHSKTFTLDKPLIYNDYTSINLGVEIPAEERNNLLLSIDVKEVNGVENTAKQAARSASDYMLAMKAGNGFRRNMVAEIATGTWCGYCPMGILGVGKMLDAHPDGSFIPIAVHYEDEMSIASYNLFQNFTDGINAPVLIVNRNLTRYGKKNPTYEIMSSMYPAVVATPAMATLTVDGVGFDADAKKLTVDASAEYAFDFTDGDSYGLAFVLTEDNVGPYLQTNYYGGEGAPEMGEWNSLPEAVEMTFNAVARQIRLFNGINGSVPAEVKQGETYAAQGTLQTNTVENINNCSVTVMLINRTTGRIENAVSRSVSELPIREVQAAPRADDSAIYDLQGRRIAAPRPGQIYLQNNRLHLTKP